MSAATQEPLTPGAVFQSSGHAAPQADLLRFTTAGSVDDGKSTLIGRLLYDSRGIYEDQLVSIQKSGINRSDGPIDLSLVTDGLRAEREQGITIDVAYRYFSTPRRKFIIADTPGHEQYTRNMATGASNADAAVILIDATRGVLTQSRRHTCIAALLGISHVVAAVNKMDLVEYREEVFVAIAREFEALARRLGIAHVHAIPVSALKGDNIVAAGQRMPWFTGPTLLQYLENVPLGKDDHRRPLRFPVQYVIRPDGRFRGFAGRLASGVLHRGAAVIALPSGARSRVKSIVTFDGELERAAAGSSVTITLEDEVDLGRGDLLADETSLPESSLRFSAKLVWLHADPCQNEKFYLLKHGTRTVRARVASILHRLDVNTLRKAPGSQPQMNDIAAVHIETTQPLFFDSYSQNRVTGSFILIDPMSNATVAAGMIEGKAEATEIPGAPGPGRMRRNPLEERMRRNGHPPAAIWIQGRPALADQVERAVLKHGWQVEIVSPADFETGDLRPAVSMLRRMGAIAVFSIETHDNYRDLRNVVEEIYGEKAFFVANPLLSSDVAACTEILSFLVEQSRYFQGDGGSRSQ
jgi:bifunctional enzyme CysN/CysC/sulfate adenylyltransferase subunit 1